VIEKVLKKDHKIHAEMTVLNIVSKHRKTEAVFKNYDKKAGVCICCQALFEPLRKVTVRYGLNLEELMADLESVAGQ
jgi:hypothetical protein